MFLTFEGIDGAGKSTQLALLAEDLRGAGYRVTRTREPGGTVLGERLRDFLLAPGAPLAAQAELAMMFAARAQHAAEVIRPALARGEVVLCDRFTDASEAYQGVGRGLGREAVAALHQILLGDLRPDITVILDLEPAMARLRARGRGGDDRIEAEGLAFLARVRQGYLEIAAREPERCIVIPAAGPEESVHAAIAAAVRPRLPAPHPLS